MDKEYIEKFILHHVNKHEGKAMISFKTLNEIYNFKNNNLLTSEEFIKFCKENNISFVPVNDLQSVKFEKNRLLDKSKTMLAR